MSIFPRKPPIDLNRILEDGDLSPDMDVYETDKEVVAKINVPGFELDQVDVKVKDGVLKVSGKMEGEKEEKGKGYWRKEIKHGSFSRHVRLPAQVKEEQIEATYEKGVLEIKMPKAEPKEGKKVEIKVKER